MFHVKLCEAAELRYRMIASDNPAEAAFLKDWLGRADAWPA